jgi:hypothetical protein
MFALEFIYGLDQEPHIHILHLCAHLASWRGQSIHSAITITTAAAAAAVFRGVDGCDRTQQGEGNYSHSDVRELDVI